MSEYEAGRRALEEFIGWYKTHVSDRNEATTRLHLIDRLFFECLGWSREDMIAEERYSGEYADYTFSSPRKMLIVEAKREGEYFEIPAEKEHIDYAISGLMKDYPRVKDAIEQAAKYCQERGVPFGAIANGTQIIAFVATRTDGSGPFEGKALVFPSLDFMSKYFLELWQALSKPAIEEKKLASRLVGGIIRELPHKLSSKIYPYPGIKNRNAFQTDLQIVSELVIEDLTRSSELEETFLRECYCQSGALSQYALTSRNILAARYAALFNEEKGGPVTKPATDKNGLSSDLLAEGLSRRPILLIGDVGVGKTAFIRHLIKVEAQALFAQAITLYIDLGSQATMAGGVEKFVPEEIDRQLKNNYSIDIHEKSFVHGVYHGDLEGFSKSVYGDYRESSPQKYKEKEIEFLAEKIEDKTEHLRKALHHVAKGRGQQIVLFLDNADQRDEQIQQKVFLISAEIAEHWPVTVFVSIRPETFHRSMEVGALSGYHPRAFTISPPRIDKVIERRLKFALKLTSGEIPIQALGGNVSLSLDKLDKIIRAFLESLGQKEELNEFIDNISGGNVRLALDQIRNFFGSGHVDTQKIYDIYTAQKQYYVPLHEFLRAVVYGDAVHYDPNQSPILNLFDVSQYDAKGHFLMPLALSFLASSQSQSDQGFVAVSEAYEYLQGFGFTPDQIDSAIIRAYKKKLIETGARKIPRPEQIQSQTLRITTIGLYHLSRLLKSFVYVDAIVSDTPIFADDVRAKIGSVDALDGRLTRALDFVDYLDRTWSTLGSTGEWFDWPTHSSIIREDIKRIQNKVLAQSGAWKTQKAEGS